VSVAVGRRSIAAPVVVLLGAGLLVLRTSALAATPALAPRVALLVIVYGAIAIASAALAPRADTPHVRPGVVLAFGLVAAFAAASTAGPSAPIPNATVVVPLSLLAALAEELLFRGVAYGELGRWGPLAAIAGSAFLFALIHLPAYGTAAMPVDLGAGLLLSWQRWASGSWKVPAATHAAANLLAALR
jgi:membrane protease YdiL (CAAX protease family)